MKRRVIAFDLDNTLADSKSPITAQMAHLMDGLLKKFQVCVISGGTFGQFEVQLLNHLKAAPRTLTALHIMPTCGTRYFRFDVAAKAWQQVYTEDLTAAHEVTGNRRHSRDQTTETARRAEED